MKSGGSHLSDYLRERCSGVYARLLARRDRVRANLLKVSMQNAVAGRSGRR